MVSALRKPDKKYFYIAETSFKDCSRNHTRDFRHKKYVNSTELSKYIRKLKDKKIIAITKWNKMAMTFANFV